jgi:hypothetical protein
MKIKYWVQTDKVESTYEDIEEIDDAEWEAMTEFEKECYMKDLALDHMEWGFEVLDESEAKS